MPPRTRTPLRDVPRGWFAPIGLALLLVLPGRTAAAASGQLKLTVVDRASGRPIPCRMHLRNARGRARKPDGVPFWEDHFVFPGEIVLTLPLGEYTFELERGPEYVERSGRFVINRFADDAKEVDLLRFVDMSSHGWWSGDLDVRRPIRDVELLMRAEDLHVVPLVTWWNDQRAWTPKSRPENPLVRFDDDRICHLMGGGCNRPGAELLLLNLPGPLPIGEAGAEYPPPGVLVEQARAQSQTAWVDLTKPFWWDLPALAAHGQIDSIEVAHSFLGRDRVIDGEEGGRPRDRAMYPGVHGNARWSQDIYFHLLNCGLRIPPSAGSGSGVGPNPAGYNRLYVYVDGELTYEKWWESLRAGRVVVTNGPLMRPSVRGEPPGCVFYGDPGQTQEFEVGLTLSTRRPISYLELIKNGRVERSVRFDEYADSGRLPKLTFDESGWFVVRAVTELGQTYRFAMTGPYYVQIGRQPRISRKSAQFFLDWVYERARQIKLADPEQQRAVIDYHRAARDFWQRRVEEANAE